MTDIFSAFGAVALAGLPAAIRVTNAQYHVNLSDVGQRVPNALETRDENTFDNTEITRSVTRNVTRENPYGEDLLPIADTQEFVSWLRVHYAKNTDITQRQLLSMYWEFCDNAFEPLTTRSLLRQIKSAGMSSRRLPPKKIGGKLKSPTVYRLKPLKTKKEGE